VLEIVNVGVGLAQAEGSMPPAPWREHRSTVVATGSVLVARAMSLQADDYSPSAIGCLR